jgi:hypothetical protein
MLLMSQVAPKALGLISYLTSFFQQFYSSQNMCVVSQIMEGYFTQLVFQIYLNERKTTSMSKSFFYIQKGSSLSVKTLVFSHYF